MCSIALTLFFLSIIVLSQKVCFASFSLVTRILKRSGEMDRVGRLETGA